MRYKIEFQYRAESQERPFDFVQETHIESETGEFVPIPNEGDTVTIDFDGGPRSYKVESRHFCYLSEPDRSELDLCAVNIVVIDVPPGEMARRLKE